MKALKAIIYITYAAALLYIVFVGGNEYRHFRPFSFEKPFALSPFQQKLGYIKSGHFEDRNEVRNMIEDVVGNLLLLVPFSFILVLGENKSGRKALLITFLTSVFIETTQYLFALGQADIDDVILNTSGALMGILLALYIKHHSAWQWLHTP